MELTSLAVENQHVWAGGVDGSIFIFDKQVQLPFSIFKKRASHYFKHSVGDSTQDRSLSRQHLQPVECSWSDALSIL